MYKSLYQSLKFDSLLDILISKILPTLNNKNVHIDFNINSDRSFVDKVKEVTSLNVTLYHNKANNNYPPVDSASIKIEAGDLSNLVGGGTDMMRHPFSDMAVLKSKAEFLERLSAALPLDHAVKVDYSIDRTFDLIKSQKLKVKSILNKDTIIKNYEYIYYYFNKYVKILESNTNNKNIQMTTNGCAGHFDYDQAVLAAWLEYIQRDGFLVYWLNTISPKVIDIDTYLVDSNEKIGNSKKGDLFKILKDFKKYNIEYYFLDITSDIDVPNVLCVILSEVRGAKRMHMGSGTGFDTNQALMSAALEAMANSTFRYTKESQPFEVKGYKPFIDKGIDKNKRQDIYYEKGMIDNINFIFKSTESISVEDWGSVNGEIKKRGYDTGRLADDTPYQMQYLKDIFKERIATNPNYNVYVYEYQNKLIKYWDYKVVRIICPALYSLYLTESYADPEHPRLAEFVRNKGWEHKAKLNIWPHPFP